MPTTRDLTGLRRAYAHILDRCSRGAVHWMSRLGLLPVPAWIKRFFSLRDQIRGRHRGTAQDAGPRCGSNWPAFDHWLAAHPCHEYLDLVELPDGSTGVWLKRDGVPAHLAPAFLVRLPCTTVATEFTTLARSGVVDDELAAFVGRAWKTCGTARDLDDDSIPF
jgi:hypothetical protein